MVTAEVKMIMVVMLTPFKFISKLPNNLIDLKEHGAMKTLQSLQSVVNEKEQINSRS
jgi:hypothetical protein